jgi:hypothetical protein
LSGIAGDLLLTIGAAGAGFGSSWLTNRRSNKTEAAKTVILGGKLELENRRVESEAYANAQKINDDVVKGLHAELDHLRRDLRSEREGRAEDNRQHAAEIQELRNLIANLRTELEVTRRQLRIPGSEPKPEPGGSANVDR